MQVSVVADHQLTVESLPTGAGDEGYCHLDAVLSQVLL